MINRISERAIWMSSASRLTLIDGLEFGCIFSDLSVLRWQEYKSRYIRDEPLSKNAV